MGRRLKNDLRRLRRGKVDLTQTELARRVGCTRQTIAAIEGQHYNPSLTLALEIAEVLEVGIQDLFWLDDGDDSG